jgi:hypothetical protein
MMVKLKEVDFERVKPNPHRDMKRYPINREKIDALKESIGRTGWWPNIVARESDGVYEIAHGHHRFTALRELKRKTVGLLVGKFSDGEMLKMMADENLREWGSSVTVDQETIRAVVLAYAGGKIELERPGAKVSKNQIRYAPGFVQGDARMESTAHPYSSQSIMGFLGWGEWKVKQALAALELQERAGLDPGLYDGLTAERAEILTRKAREIEGAWDRSIAGVEKIANKETAHPRARQSHAEKSKELKAKKAKELPKAIKQIATQLKADDFKREKIQALADKAKPRVIEEVSRQKDIADEARRIGLWVSRLLKEGEEISTLKKIIADKKYLANDLRDRLIQLLEELSERAKAFSNRLK